jgi:hypothetical protein
MSAFPSIATKLRTSLLVRFVPLPEVKALLNHLVGSDQHVRRVFLIVVADGMVPTDVWF